MEGENKRVLGRAFKVEEGKKSVIPEHIADIVDKAEEWHRKIQRCAGSDFTYKELAMLAAVAELVKSISAPAARPKTKEDVEEAIAALDAPKKRGRKPKEK